MRLDYAVHTHPAIRDWLHRLYSLGRGHGSQLVEDMARPYHTDNARTAELLLEALTAEGWIMRDPKPSPTRTQVFAGVGGRGPGHRPNAGNAYYQEFGYTP